MPINLFIKPTFSFQPPRPPNPLQTSQRTKLKKSIYSGFSTENTRVYHYAGFSGSLQPY
jgi:hypothetical protein